jgi:hypothetical protein
VSPFSTFSAICHSSCPHGPYRYKEDNHVVLLPGSSMVEHSAANFSPLILHRLTPKKLPKTGPGWTRCCTQEKNGLDSRSAEPGLFFSTGILR